MAYLLPQDMDFCRSCSFSSLHFTFTLLSRVLVQKDARLLRDLRIMAYFRQCFPSNLNITTIKELAHALASHPPYEVPISSVKIRHLHCEVGSRCWLNCCSVVLKILCFSTYHFDCNITFLFSVGASRIY